MRMFVFGLLFFSAFDFVCASDYELLLKVDSLASYMDSDYKADYEVVQTRPGQDNSVTKFRLFRRDNENKYVITILAPEISRGQGYLKEGETLWFYDPESKKFNTTSSRERFRNSNASNSDFTRSTLAQDYTPVSGTNEKLGRFNCRVLNLEAKTKDLTYPKMKIWISEDNLARKMEDYSLSGQLLRTTEISSYYKIGKRSVPVSLRITDALRGALINGKFQNERTIISISEPVFQKLPNLYFSKTYLESVSRRSL